MKEVKNTSWSLLGLQLLVNVCHVLIHHFALHLLWTKSATPSALSELLVYAGGLSCIAFVGVMGSQLQRRQRSDDSNPFDTGSGSAGVVLLIIASFVAEGITQYLVQ
jgi:hypothetical protein